MWPYLSYNLICRPGWEKKSKHHFEIRVWLHNEYVKPLEHLMSHGTDPLLAFLRQGGTL